MSSKILHYGSAQVKPAISLSQKELRHKSIELYKAFYRAVPHMVQKYDLEISATQCRKKLREKFLEHKGIKDLRVMDYLIAQAEMELVEFTMIWKQQHTFMKYFDSPTTPKKPEGFLEKFYAGEEC